MTKIEKFKHQLVCVFDDNLHTKVWHNIADWTIIGLIIISSLEVFLSTFSGIAEKYGEILHFIDIFTTIVFTIEVSLRIWVADELDPKYKGFKGRLRYCFSFYGLIDFLSTYPFYLGFFMKVPVAALKILRVARLLRIFRYMKSFRILGEAISSKKQELGISLAFLSILTVILSFLLYYAEHDAQPDLCENGWQALVWAFAKYLGDPGKIADFPLVTVWGHIIATIVGVLGICIFAVPAGLIGSGFVEVIEARRHENSVSSNIEKLHESFERKLERLTRFQCVPQNISIAAVQALQNMSETDVFEAVAESSDMRIVNLADSVPIDDHPVDRLAIECFPLNTEYGCKIDRQSKVTIVATSNYSDLAMSNFAYYLAKIGGFNYVSRETGSRRPARSYYIPDGDDIPGYSAFKADVEELSAGDGRWIITLLASDGGAEPMRPTQLHITYGGPIGNSSFDEEGLLVHDTETAEKLFSRWEERLSSEFGLKSDRQGYHESVNPRIFIRHLSNVSAVNGVVLRCAWSMICWDSRRIQIAKMIAEVLHQTIEPEHSNEGNEKELMIKGIAFDDYKN